MMNSENAASYIRLKGGLDVRLTPEVCLELTANMDRATRVSCLIQSVEALTPFWLRAIEVCGTRIGLTEEKIAELTRRAISTPEWCRKWNDGERVVKARLNECWQSTSMVWNAALDSRVRDLAIAPQIRNMHKNITSLFHLASDHRMDPGSLIYEAYSMAFLRTRFAFDKSDLMHFAPRANLTGDENLGYRNILIYAQAAQEMEMIEEMQSVFDDAFVVAKSFGAIPKIDADQIDWNEIGSSYWYELRYGAMQDFHAR